MTPTSRQERRTVLGLAAALAMVGVLTSLPTPGPATRVQGSDVPQGLTDRWPGARPVTVSATLPDGDAYSPLLVRDAATSVGLATTPDGRGTALVMWSGPAGRRSLQALSPGTGDTVVALTEGGGRLYWIRSGTGGDGRASASLWTATLSGGPAGMLSADAGAAISYGSRYDLQIADGHLYWVAAPPSSPGAVEVRSVALGGGPVSVQTLPGTYALADWPWLTSAIGTGGPIGRPGELLNLRTGQRISIAPGPDQQVRCTSTWCRVTTSTGPGDRVVIERPDGRERRGIALPDGAAAVTDVAVLDRFEILTTPLSPDPDSVAQRLLLYDVRTHRKVTVAPAVTRVSAHGDWVWWTTGDNETLAWHLLDLATLG
jgi:hypothetical protein